MLIPPGSDGSPKQSVSFTSPILRLLLLLLLECSPRAKGKALTAIVANVLLVSLALGAGNSSSVGLSLERGAAVTGARNVPMRRWEDWERSRLRKIRREEKRRREFERTHGAYIGSNGELTARSEVFSQYDGSDTVSVASSDDDHWGAQIGGYNENSVQYPPPPVGLMPNAFASAETVAGSDLEAMLEVGFDDRPSPGRARGGRPYPVSRTQSSATPRRHPGREPLQADGATGCRSAWGTRHSRLQRGPTTICREHRSAHA